MSETIAPDRKLAVTLDAQTWNVVLQLVSGGPFNQVAALMQELQTQLRNAAQTDTPTLASRDASTLREVS